MALVNNVNESILDQLGTMEPVEQAKLDMRLHAQALMDDSRRFGSRDEKFLQEDMGVKQKFIRIMQNDGTPEEKASVAKRLLRDKAIHQKYLTMPEMPGRGSKRWHQTWSDVYDGWLKTLGQPRTKAKLPAGMPPPPPPELSGEWAAFDEQEAYQGQADAGAVYDWSQPIPEYNYYPEPTNAYQDYSAYDPNATTDQAVNQVDSFGNYYNPQTGYVTSPEGNQYVDGVWQSNDGTMVLSDDGWVPAAPVDTAGPEDIQSGIIANDPNAYDPSYAANPDIYAPAPIDGTIRDYSGYDPSGSSQYVNGVWQGTTDTSPQAPVGQTRVDLVEAERQRLVDQYVNEGRTTGIADSVGGGRDMDALRAIANNDDATLRKIAEENVDKNFAESLYRLEISAAQKRATQGIADQMMPIQQAANTYVVDKLINSGLLIRQDDGSLARTADEAAIAAAQAEAVAEFNANNAWLIDPIINEAQQKFAAEAGIIKSQAQYAATATARAELEQEKGDWWHGFSTDTIKGYVKENISKQVESVGKAGDMFGDLPSISVGIGLPGGGNYEIKSEDLMAIVEAGGQAGDWTTDQFIAAVDGVPGIQNLSPDVAMQMWQSWMAAGTALQQTGIGPVAGAGRLMTGTAGTVVGSIAFVEGLYESGAIDEGTRHFMYSFIADPTNALPVVGVVEADQLRSLARVAKIASETKGANITAEVAQSVEYFKGLGLVDDVKNLMTLPQGSFAGVFGPTGGSEGNKIIHEAAKLKDAIAAERYMPNQTVDDVVRNLKLTEVFGSEKVAKETVAEIWRQADAGIKVGPAQGPLPAPEVNTGVIAPAQAPTSVGVTQDQIDDYLESIFAATGPEHDNMLMALGKAIDNQDYAAANNLIEIIKRSTDEATAVGYRPIADPPWNIVNREAFPGTYRGPQQQDVPMNIATGNIKQNPGIPQPQDTLERISQMDPEVRDAFTSANFEDKGGVVGNNNRPLFKSLEENKAAYLWTRDKAGFAPPAFFRNEMNTLDAGQLDEAIVWADDIIDRRAGDYEAVKAAEDIKQRIAAWKGTPKGIYYDPDNGLTRTLGFSDVKGSNGELEANKAVADVNKKDRKFDKETAGDVRARLKEAEQADNAAQRLGTNTYDLEGQVNELINLADAIFATDKIDNLIKNGGDNLPSTHPRNSVAQKLDKADAIAKASEGLRAMPALPSDALGNVKGLSVPKDPSVAALFDKPVSSLNEKDWAKVLKSLEGDPASKAIAHNVMSEQAAYVKSLEQVSGQIAKVADQAGIWTPGKDFVKYRRERAAVAQKANEAEQARLGRPIARTEPKGEPLVGDRRANAELDRINTPGNVHEPNLPPMDAGMPTYGPEVPLPFGTRWNTFDEIIVKLQTAPKSATEFLRDLIRHGLENVPLMGRASEAGWLQTREIVPAVLHALKSRQEASLSIIAHFHLEVTAGLSGAGVRPMLGGQYDVGLDRGYYLHELLNTTPTNLSDEVVSQLDYIKYEIDLYRNFLTSKGVDENEFFKLFGLKKGQYLPDNVAPDLAERPPYKNVYDDKGKVETGNQPIRGAGYEVARMVEAMSNEITNRWWKELSDNLVVEGTGFNWTTLGDLRQVAKESEIAYFDELKYNGPRTPKQEAELQVLRNKYESTKAEVHEFELEFKDQHKNFFGALEGINNNMRALNATLDASFLGVNGMLGSFVDLESTVKAMGLAMGHALDAIPVEAFERLGIGNTTESARAHFMIRHRDAISDGISHNLYIGGPRNATEFTAQFIENIGIGKFKPFAFTNDMFTDFGNAKRILAYQQVLDTARANGIVLTPAQKEAYADTINAMSGVGRKLFNTGNDVLDHAGNFVMFAPRFFQSQFALIAKSLTTDLKSLDAVKSFIPGRDQLNAVAAAHTSGGRLMSPGDMARNSLATMSMLGVAGIAGANAALGNDDLDWKTPWHKDKDGNYYPNPNFLAIRFKGNDIKIFGTWDTLLRLGSLASIIGYENVRDAVNGKSVSLPSDLAGFAGTLIQYKGSPVAKAALEAVGLIDSLGETFPTDKKYFGWDAPKIVDFMVNAGVKLSPFFVQTLAHEGANANVLYAALGIKSSKMTAGETYNERMNESFKTEYNRLKADEPDASEQSLKDRAWLRAQESDAGQKALRDYATVAAAKGQEWGETALARIKINDDMRATKADNDKDLTNWWNKEGKSAQETRQKEQDDIDNALTSIFGSREALDKQLDALYKQREAVSGQIDATKGATNPISGQIDSVKAEAQKIADQMKAIRDADIAAGRKYTSNEAYIKLSVTKAGLDKQLDGLYDQARGWVSPSAALYDKSKDLTAVINELKDLKDAQVAASDPRVAALLDRQEQLKLDQRLAEREVEDWKAKQKLAETVASAKLDYITTEFKGDPKDTADVIRMGLSGIYNKKDENGEFLYKNKDGSIDNDAWDMINIEKSALRSTLTDEEKLLYDMITAPEPKSGLELTYQQAQQALTPEAGMFFGKDVRINKPESTLYGAALLSVPGMSAADVENDYIAFQNAPKAAQMVDEAEKAVMSGDPALASKTLAYIAENSGADPSKLVGEFRDLVQSNAMEAGIPRSQYEPAMYDVSISSVRDAMNSTEPYTPNISGKAQYEVSESGRAAGQAVSSSGLPSPDFVPQFAMGTTPPNTQTPASGELIDYFTDIIKQDFFGRKVDFETGTVTAIGYGALAPSRQATYQYLYDHNLRDKDSIIAEAQRLLKANESNPQVQMLMLADPSVRLAFANAGSQYEPAARNYIIAIDKVLRALEGEEVISQQQAVTGYKDSLGDRYFSIFNAAQLPAVTKIDEQIDALYNSKKVDLLSTQLALNSSAITDLYAKVKYGTVDRTEFEQELKILEDARISLAEMRQTAITENNALIEQLKMQRDTLVNAKPVPSDKIFEYLLSKQADEKDEIKTVLTSLLNENENDPRIQNLLAVAAGTAAPLPELAAWIQQRTAEWATANDRLGNNGQAVLPPEQQVMRELQDVTALLKDQGAFTPSPSRLIVAGSAIMAAVGDKPANVSGGYNTDTGEATVGHAMAEGTHGGGAVQPTPVQASMPPTQTGSAVSQMPTAPSSPNAFNTSTPMPSPPRTPNTSSTSTGTNRPTTTTRNTQTYSPTTQAANSVPQSELQFATKTWPEFKTTATSIFGDQRMLVVMEKAFGQGRAITDPKTLRQLRFIWKLAPISGATSFDGWMAALRLMYGGVQVAATGRQYQQREIRTNFERV